MKSGKKRNFTINDLALLVGRGFNAVDKRFDAVDKRFGEIDKRFNAVDKKLFEINQRLGKKNCKPIFGGFWVLESSRHKNNIIP
jgi:tetrahydromethanopterin S-methyltransferase subunit G